MFQALIAIGSNLAAPGCADSLATCEAALNALETHDICIAVRSRWYRTAPVPASDQPDFVNGLVAVETLLDPASLLAVLHSVEDRFARRRSVPNAARTLDLDLIDVAGVVRDGPDGPVLPHPRMQERAFVLVPLRDVAPDWRHPRTGQALDALLAVLPEGQRCCPIPS